MDLHDKDTKYGDAKLYIGLYKLVLLKHDDNVIGERTF